MKLLKLIIKPCIWRTKDSSIAKQQSWVFLTVKKNIQRIFFSILLLLSFALKVPTVF